MKLLSNEFQIMQDIYIKIRELTSSIVADVNAVVVKEARTSEASVQFHHYSV